jgi:2-polyprenyl-6-methoxyphenol hydroxylase-like FAD-dependent oxidoreductase
VSATVCIAGGGPAGIMLGYLLARAGIDVTVLEKHADFFRDFRGDTVHPSTLQVMDELGLLDGLLAIPHSEVREISLRTPGESLLMAQFDGVPGRCKFVAFMPQWDLLNFLAAQGRRYPSFHLLMETEAVGLLRDGGQVTGVRVRTAQGEQEIRADLVVACDGRHSTLRDCAQLRVIDIAAPIDVLWLRLSKHANDPQQTFGNIVPGGILVALDRRGYYQCAFVIRKGGIGELQARGLEAFREDVATAAPFLRDRVGEIATWDDVKLLTVKIDRLERWWLPGLLCIGDAAHAMSPVGGIGINLAIQDAVAAANILTPALRRGAVTESDLRAVQQRREFPTKVTQWLQTQAQNRVLNQVLQARTPIHIPGFVRFLARFAAMRRIPARIIGVGIRPEHVRPYPDQR